LYKNLGKIFFCFVTIQTFVRWTGRQTAFSWLDRVACNAYIQRGKDNTSTVINVVIQMTFWWRH